MHQLLHILHNNLVGCIEFAGQFVNDDLDRGDAIAAFQNLEHDLIGQEQPLGWQNRPPLYFLSNLSFMCGRNRGAETSSTSITSFIRFPPARRLLAG